MKRAGDTPDAPPAKRPKGPGIDVLFLNAEEVMALSPTISETNDLCKLSFTEHGNGTHEMPPKPGVHSDERSFIHAMPGLMKKNKYIGIKWVAGYPANVPKGLPTIAGLIILNDIETGFPKAIMDGTYITAIRTAGASAVTLPMVRTKADPTCLAVNGTGVQGVLHAIFLLGQLPSVKTVKCYDTWEPSLANFCTKVTERFPGVMIDRANGVEDCLRGADIVCCCAGNPGQAIYHESMVKPGATVFMVSGSAWPRDFFQKPRKFIVDDWPQVQLAMHSGYDGFGLTPFATTGELLVGKKGVNGSARTSDEETIYIYNSGLGLHDLAVGEYVLAKAKERGVGTVIAVQQDVTTPVMIPAP